DLPRVPRVGRGLPPRLSSSRSLPPVRERPGVRIVAPISCPTERHRANRARVRWELRHHSLVRHSFLRVSRGSGGIRKPKLVNAAPRLSKKRPVSSRARYVAKNSLRRGQRSARRASATRWTKGSFPG